MTDLTTGGAEAIIDAALASAEPHPLDPANRFYAVRDGDNTRVVDLETHLDQHRSRPRRKKGTYSVHDVPSFAAYFQKHSTDRAEVWADTTAHTLAAVLNAHGEGIDSTDDGAEWEDHRLQYVVQKTDAWKAWTALNGKMLPQVDFAEHIENRAIDIFDPSPAEMLEIAQHFQAKTNVDFESGELLSSGERQLTYVETTNAKAGQKGHLDIPSVITLQLRPFEGADVYALKARFRYRIAGGNLALGYVLERPEDILREAFEDVVKAVEAEISETVLRGSGGGR